MPTPRSRARSSATAPIATSHAAIPFDLKTTMSSSACRPDSSPATTSCSSCTSSQSSTPTSTGSIRSPDSRLASSTESQQTKAARSSTTLSSSRRRGSFAPTAQTSEPGRSHSPRSTGSREVVTVTTTSCEAGSRWLSPGSAPTSRQNSARRSSLRQYATTVSIPGSASRIAATWLRACQPQPITPSEVAPSRARYFAATPLAAPVRSWPSLSASITATAVCVSVSKSTTTKVEFAAPDAYVLTPASPSSWSAAHITASAPSSKRVRCRGTFSTSPAASRRKQASTASSASAGLSSSATSASVRYSGTARGYWLLLGDEADLAAALEHRPAHLLERVELALAGPLLELPAGQPLAREVRLEHAAVLDQHDRLAGEHLPHAAKAVVEVRDGHLQERDRARGEDETGHRVVALRHALLHEVTEHDQHDQVERLERRQLAAADDPRQEEDERESEGRSDDDVH